MEHIIKYKEEFEYSDLSFSDIFSMNDMVKHYIKNGSKREKRLAKNLAKAVLWIEREIYTMQNKS